MRGVGTCFVFFCLFVFFVCFCFVFCYPEGFTTVVANMGLEKARAYLNQIPQDRQLYIPSELLQPCWALHVLHVHQSDGPNIPRRFA